MTLNSWDSDCYRSHQVTTVMVSTRWHVTRCIIATDKDYCVTSHEYWLDCVMTNRVEERVFTEPSPHRARRPRLEVLKMNRRITDWHSIWNVRPRLISRGHHLLSPHLPNGNLIIKINICFPSQKKSLDQEGRQEWNPLVTIPKTTAAYRSSSQYPLEKPPHSSFTFKLPRQPSDLPGPFASSPVPFNQFIPSRKWPASKWNSKVKQPTFWLVVSQPTNHTTDRTVTPAS